MKNPTISIFFTPIICLIMLFAFNNRTFAQEYGIYELEQTSIAGKSSDKPQKSNKNSRSEFYNLYQNLHPTIYMENMVIKKVYGEGPITRLTLMDAQSINGLNNQKDKFNDVRLVTIKLKKPSELNAPIKLDKNDGFNNLEYVFLKCYFEYTVEDIKKFAKVNPNVRVFHISANPS